MKQPTNVIDELKIYQKKGKLENTNLMFFSSGKELQANS